MMKLIFILTLLLMTQFASAEEFIVIVNDKNPVNEISASTLAHFFLKETNQWSNGTPVRFFDQREDSELHRFFLNDILKKSPRELELYWIGQKLYTGSRAPLQLGTDTMMSSMVSRFPGAIGYVSPTFTGAPGVKKIELKKD
jgi:ABC-type phosphate transport system substrate-binding protein